MLTCLGKKWWDPWHTIYTSTMDPMGWRSTKTLRPLLLSSITAGALQYAKPNVVSRDVVCQWPWSVIPVIFHQMIFLYIYILYTQYINFKIHCWWIYSRLEWWCRRLDSGRLAGRVLYIVSYSGFSQPKRKTRVQYNTIMPYHFYAHVHCPQIIGLTQHLPSPQPEQKHHWTTAFHGVTRDWAGASARDNSSQLITRWCLQDINWLINLANTYSIYIYMSCVYTHIYIYTYFMCIYIYNVYIYMCVSYYWSCKPIIPYSCNLYSGHRKRAQCWEDLWKFLDSFVHLKTKT